MRCAALQQHLREAAGRRADVERPAAGRIEAEMVEPGNQLQRRAGHVVAGGVVDPDIARRGDGLAGLAGDRAIDRHSAAPDGVTGARAARVEAAADEQLVQPEAIHVLLRSDH